MAEITYQLNGELPENIPGFEQYQDKDTNLIESFQINNLFDPTKNFSELHILDLADTLLSSKYYYTGYKLSLNAQSAGKDGASILTIDPIQDALNSGYSFGGIKLLYHFLNDLYTPDNTTLDFYIDSISPDRTELQLLTHNLTAEDVVRYTELVKTNLKSQSYFSEFRLNFKNNNLLIGVNIDNLDTINGKAVVIKLYEPLPDDFDIKSTLSLVEIISDSIAYEIDYQQTLDEPVFPTLRSANFNLDIQDENVIPTQYLNYDDLLSYKVSNTNSEIYSMISEKGVELSIDYSDYSNFVHFSSAQERLLNFKYKLDLLASYSQSLATKGSATGGAQGVSGSVAYYEGLYQGIINNFDHYERFLYYESGSSSWPKTNNVKPYINQVSSLATTWYNSALTAAVAYDSTNYNSLIETIPTYLRDDPANDNYLTFVYMVGQHFDNLWVYGDAVTDKYDNDNRLNYGISKDLVGEALKNFGVKLYTSNKSIEDLFSTFIGQAYQSGSEKINYYITGSLTGSNTPIQPTSFDNYQKEIQKRIYHNLPLLLKSKGTERGLRALINCFGIPGDILDIKLYGGRDTYKRPVLGDSQYYTSSLDKIRLDNTGSIVSGDTLSNYTSIVKRDDKYTDDIHVIEVGFSPTDNIDTYIVSKSAATFSIDDYLGDPRSLYLDNYSGLYRTANTLLSSSLGTSGSYDLRDYVRLIKFFDNTVFKMVKDFIPARSVADTGVIIKPHILNVSKAKSVRVSGSRPEYTGSIDTAFISSKNASTFNFQENEYGTSYSDSIQTPNGILTEDRLHGQEQAKYNGELLRSSIVASSRDLNKANRYKVLSYIENNYDIVFVSSSNEVCILSTNSGLSNPVFIDPNIVYTNVDFFSNTNPSTSYSASNSATAIPFTPTYNGINLNNGYQFNTGLSQYDYFYIKADNWNYTLGSCTQTITARYGICGLSAKKLSSYSVVQYSSTKNNTYDLRTWFDKYAGQSELQYTASYNGTTVGITNPDSYKFNQSIGTSVTILVIDTKLASSCTAKQVVNVNSCVLGATSVSDWASITFSGEYRFIEFEYSYWKAYNIATARYAEFNRRQLGRSRTNSSGQLSTWGIQAYFTPQTVTDIYENNTLRYTIYELKVDSTGTLYSLYKRRSLVNANATDALTCCTLTETTTTASPVVFSGASCSNYAAAAASGYFSSNKPITIEVPSVNTEPTVYRNTYTVNIGRGQTETRTDIIVGDPVSISPFNLPQAYIIEATNNNPTNLCMSQITVYGSSGTLWKVEGYGNYFQFQAPGNSYHTSGDSGGWLLTGWDYSTGTTPAGANEYPNVDPGSNYGPWVYVQIRRFSETAYK